MLDQIALSEIQLGHLLRLHRSQATFPAQRNHADTQDVETYALPYKVDSVNGRFCPFLAILRLKMAAILKIGQILEKSCLTFLPPWGLYLVQISAP